MLKISSIPRKKFYNEDFLFCIVAIHMRIYLEPENENEISDKKIAQNIIMKPQLWAFFDIGFQGIRNQYKTDRISTLFVPQGFCYTYMFFYI